MVQSPTTLSEAMQSKFNRKECPEMERCSHFVTKDFFIKVCKNRGYFNCIHYARLMGEVKIPLTWLTTLAVDIEKGNLNSVDNVINMA